MRYTQRPEREAGSSRGSNPSKAGTVAFSSSGAQSTEIANTETEIYVAIVTCEYVAPQPRGCNISRKKLYLDDGIYVLST